MKMYWRRENNGIRERWKFKEEGVKEIKFFFKYIIVMFEYVKL